MNYFIKIECKIVQIMNKIYEINDDYTINQGLI